MKLKSYFSGSVEEAVETARKELGEDSLLVNARPTTPETRHLGAYEVVFGIEIENVAPPKAATSADRMAQDLAEMKREIERLAKGLSGARTMASSARPDSELYSRLLANELD